MGRETLLTTSRASARGPAVNFAEKVCQWRFDVKTISWPTLLKTVQVGFDDIKCA